MPKPRGRKNLPVKPIFHIFCEGEKTEPNYLLEYIRIKHSNNILCKLIKIEKTKKNTPKQLVEEAKTLKTDHNTPKDDEFWVIYDRESKEKYPDKLHKSAIDMANKANIRIAISNVCFELWILLHFKYVSAPYICHDDLLKRSGLKGELKKIGIGKYEKSDREIAEKIINLTDTARINAKIMNESTIKASNTDKSHPHLLNPYTNVHELLDAIDKFSDKNIVKK